MSTTPRVRERFGHCLSWGIFGEDLPDESNRVTLDPSSSTRRACRAPRVTYRARRTRGGCSTSTSSGRRESLLEAGAHERRLADPDAQRRLAPARHGAHGQRPGDVGRRPRGARRTTSTNLYVVDGSVFVDRPAASTRRTRSARSPALRRPPGGRTMTDAELLAREAARLLPGGAGLPGAAELDLVLARAGGARGGRCAARGHEPDRDALLLVVADAYYAHPAVRAALGYPGPRAIPLPRSPTRATPSSSRSFERGACAGAELPRSRRRRKLMTP